MKEIVDLLGATGAVVRAARALRHAPADEVIELLRELGAAVDAFERGEPAAKPVIGKPTAETRKPRNSRQLDRSAAVAATGVAARPIDVPVTVQATELPTGNEPPASQLCDRERIKAKLREALERRTEAASG